MAKGDVERARHVAKEGMERARHVAKGGNNERGEGAQVARGRGLIDCQPLPPLLLPMRHLARLNLCGDLSLLRLHLLLLELA